MSKFSVKKPLTVLVAVIIVIVLGIVSYTKMTPDLLPNIDMPYVVVVTSYPGASPEKVEATVTKPLEQAMGTLENIKEIQSSSSENVSLLMMEFSEDANLDAVSVDILQKVSLIEGAWDDMVGTPTILKINPSMLPVMVTAVSMEGMDNGALSAFVNDTLMPKLEGTSGVASISASGLLEEEISVTLDEEKINRLNDTVTAAISGQFAGPQAELNDAQAEIDSGRAEISSGEDQLKAGQGQMQEQLGSAGAQLNQKQQELLEGKQQLEEQIQALEEQLQTVKDNETQLLEIQEKISSLETAQTQLSEAVSQLTALNQALPGLEASAATFEEQIKAIEGNGSMTQEQKDAAVAALKDSQAYRETMGALAAIDVQLAAQGLSRADVPTALLESQQGLLQVEEGLAAVDSALGEMGLTRGDVASSLAQVQQGRTQLEGALSKLNETLDGLESGQVKLGEAMSQLEAQKLAAIFEMNDASVQLLLGKQKLDDAATQVEEGMTQLQEAREAALKQADLSSTLTVDTVKALLAAQNFDMPAGYVTGESGADIIVSVGDAIVSREELADTVLLDLGLDGVEPIRLQDVARVEITDNSAEIYAKINGEDGVMLSFSKQSNAATAEVSDALAKAFSNLEKEFPGLAFTPMMDQGDYIYMIVRSILQNILLGAIFAVLVLFFFLKDLKPTLITLCSIPLSLLFAIVLMYFSGVTLNMLSLSGLAVAVGMLVDNSVVVIENIYRLRGQGVSAYRSAVFGAKQMAAAITSSTVTTICVFLPIVFVEGLTRQLFVDMSLTMAYALIASLIVALTLVPAMASRLLKNNQEKEHRWFDRFIGGYERLLRFVLGHRAVALILSVVLLGASIVGAFSRGFSFMPAMGSDQLSVSVEMPEGASFAETAEMADQVQEQVRGVNGVGTVGAMIGGSSMQMLSGGSAQTVTMYVMLAEDTKRPSGQVAQDIETACQDLACTVSASDGSQMDSAMSAVTGSGISIRVYGADLQTLQQAAGEVAQVLSQVPGTVEVSDGLEDTDPELHFVVNKEKAAAKGLTVAQVYAQLSSALADGGEATSLTEDGRTYQVKLYSSAAGKMTAQQLRDYTFTVTSKATGEDVEVKLSEIADIEETETVAAINRLNQKRYLTVSAGVAEDYNVSLVTEEVQKALKDYQAPEGISLEFAGENEAIMEAMEQLVLMLLLGVLLVYLTMVAQFQSLKSPFIVMFTIPLAFTGGMLALWMLGMTVSVISLIGFVMLCGIIVNNGIVLVDYINQLRAGGMEKRQAIVEAGKTRMRPILMTSITTILGMLVTAVSGGQGAAMMRPIAVVCIGGLAYATLLTLFIIPVVYDLFNRKPMKLVRDEELADGEDITGETVL